MEKLNKQIQNQFDIMCQTGKLFRVEVTQLSYLKLNHYFLIFPYRCLLQILRGRHLLFLCHQRIS